MSQTPDKANVVHHQLAAARGAIDWARKDVSVSRHVGDALLHMQTAVEALSEIVLAEPEPTGFYSGDPGQ